MKKQNEHKTFIYGDLGFPIKLINASTRIVFGETVLDINLGKFQRNALQVLVYKSQPLTAVEIRFIRKYSELTTTAFGHALGVTTLPFLSGNLVNATPPPRRRSASACSLLISWVPKMKNSENSIAR